MTLLVDVYVSINNRHLEHLGPNRTISTQAPRVMSRASATRGHRLRPEVSNRFTALWQRNRRELTVERRAAPFFADGLRGNQNA